MKTINSLEDLKGYTLQFGDEVNMLGIKHIVTHEHLNAENAFLNRTVFKLLDLDTKKMCAEFYGYSLYSGDWPEIHYQDYEALTRVVKALYEHIQGIEIKLLPFNKPNGRNCFSAKEPNKPIQIIAGCFSGTIDEFEKEAKETYPTDPVEAYEYEIKMLKEYYA